MDNKHAWKAHVLPVRGTTDPTGTQTIWIDEEQAAKNLIKSGEYIFVNNKSKIGM